MIDIKLELSELSVICNELDMKNLGVNFFFDKEYSTIYILANELYSFAKKIAYIDKIYENQKLELLNSIFCNYDIDIFCDDIIGNINNGIELPLSLQTFILVDKRKIYSYNISLKLYYVFLYLGTEIMSMDHSIIESEWTLLAQYMDLMRYYISESLNIPKPDKSLRSKNKV